jgi:hypothetical protein
MSVVQLDQTRTGAVVFEALENIDSRDKPGSPVQEKTLGQFDVEVDAIAAARDARREFFDRGESDFAWWIVRPTGARLAHWISDSNSDKEYVLDLRSGQLVER